MARASRITFVFSDEAGQTSTMNLNIPSDTSVADAKVIAGDMETELQGFTNGRIEGATLTIDLNDTVNAGNTNSGAVAGSDVEDKVTFLFETSDGFTTRVAVPTVDEDGVFLEGTDIVDETGDAGSFIVRVLNGYETTDGVSTQTSLTDQRESDIVVYKAGYQTFVNRNRRR